VTQSLLSFLFLLSCTAFIFADPAPLDCRIDRFSTRNRSLNVACNIADLPHGRVGLQFADQFAGIDGLSERVYALKIADAQGVVIKPEIHGDGQYAFESSGAATIRYEMRLARAYDPAAHALVSSLGPEAAVLMLADLLPRFCAREAECDRPVRLRIDAPTAWTIATTEKHQGEVFDIPDPSRAVFFLGALRRRDFRIGEMSVRTAITGAWRFRDDEVFALAEAIARRQVAIIDSKETGEFLVTLAPYPQPMTGLRSSAVTMGRAVVLMLNESGDAARSLAHYRRHLAHEMFHFYLPNAFRVRENFDWFWEGFTRYIALLALMQLKQITFAEYLDAIGEEYQAYTFNPPRAQISLIDASPEKFAGAAYSDLVYRKGMLVAALYDWELRWRSRGRAGVVDVVRAIYRDHAHREIGNRELLDALRLPGDFARQVRDDIETAREIDLAARIKAYGLSFERSAATNWKARLSAAAKLSDRQREFLARLAESPPSK
jgi:predicted metalloprotease with PDZ domain